MARGFESKSVADQQAESAQGRPARSQNGVIDPAIAARRRKLELSRVDIERRLAVATAPAHRQMLERALRALLDEIESLA